MKYCDYFRPFPRPEDDHQSHYPGCRTYYVERDADGATLHPVRSLVSSRSTGDLVSICIALVGTPRANALRRIPASDLRPGDLVKAEWPPSEDAIRLASLGDWQYSPLSVVNIRNNSHC